MNQITVIENGVPTQYAEWREAAKQVKKNMFWKTVAEGVKDAMEILGAEFPEKGKEK